MLGSLLAIGLMTLVIVWDRRVLAFHPRVVWLVPAVVLALLIPFTIPVEWVYPRALGTVLCVVLAGKSYELLRGRVPDPRMLDPLATFVFWLVVPPKSRLPLDIPEAERVRALGQRRLGRALLKSPGIAVLTLLHLHWPGLHDNAWLEAHWALWITYLGVSAFIDVFTGLAMQTGIHVAEGFDLPPLARSPRDFWGRRWNLVVHDLAFRHVFLPLGGLRKPLRSTIGVFVVSGLIHEYFVVATLGRASAYTGWMMAFFGLHGLAVMVQLAWDRGPGRRKKMARPLAVALHLSWITLTAPLFFAPIGEIFAGAWPN
ncbi:MAG: membrane bound O-acyl transferase family-domain-containing protein [Deltaproteobacteria bacterium]|nr:membrane bound O-acyl transferase family-domain-containing protein [Deltaproteobacteria bacterium]